MKSTNFGMVNKTKYKFHNSGVSYEKDGKNITIQHPYIKKKKLASNVKLNESNCGRIRYVEVDKRINGNRYSAAFNTEREAYKFLDVALIKEGLEPQFILKKND